MKADRVQQRLFTVEQAAAYLGRSANAVRGLIYDGKIPVVRIDRRTQLDIRDLDKLIEERKEMPATNTGPISSLVR
jgi:excisionase family DNA binding protein